MKHAAAFLVFYAALWWLWMLLAGEWNGVEWIAASGAALVGAAIAEIVRTRARAHPGAPLSVLASAPSALGMVFVDFAIVLAGLVRRRKGAFVTRPTDVAATPEQRAWATYLATLSPNAYLIDVDPERQTSLTHHLVPYKPSQDPA